MPTRFVQLLLTSTFLTIGAAAFAADAVPTVPDGISGVVTSAKGPEAGVWVIAETDDLATRLIKIVVTDDQGRYAVPELPKAKYRVWVRGYGLIDSKAVENVEPGKKVNLTAVIAPDAKSAAKIYPANYWFSLLAVPPESDFPGTGPKGNGISPAIRTQQMWMASVMQCLGCHQQGIQSMREPGDPSPEGWAERISMARPDGDHILGNHGKDFAMTMNNAMTSFGRSRGLQMWADYTTRIAKGALPSEAPPRPSGIERNLVITSWDWANGRYVHDVVASDKYNPTVNAGGMTYGIAGMFGYFFGLDMKSGKQIEIGYKVNYGKNAEKLPADQVPDQFPHTPMIGPDGRLWADDMGRFGAPRPGDKPYPENPAWCTDAGHKYAKYWPMPGQAKNSFVVYDPKTTQIEGGPMCGGMQHIIFANDKKTLYFANSFGNNDAIQWLDTKEWDQTKESAKAAGWCPMVLDTNSTTPNKVGAANEVTITPDRAQWNLINKNGGGRRDADGETMSLGQAAAAALDPKKDTRLAVSSYGMDTSSGDSAVWEIAFNPSVPSGIIRMDRGSNAPETCKTEFFEPPLLADGKNYAAYHARGLALDSKGTVWVSFTGNGRLGRFDTAKCKVRSGPMATGQHCPEGWEFFQVPGPEISNAKGVSADYSYLMWLDLHNTTGLGNDVPFVLGSNSDSLLGFDYASKKWTTLRVPYPLGFHTRSADGRVDDGKAGWKGKGTFATYANGPVWIQEGGEDASGPQMVKFQFRPDPLAY